MMIDNNCFPFVFITIEWKNFLDQKTTMKLVCPQINALMNGWMDETLNIDHDQSFFLIIS